ncbi:MAG: hypothetical protein WCJ64_27060 [Rhodospirillaceae bacterium]
MPVAQPARDLIGLGIYTVPEASRLIHIPSQRIRRWIRGYAYGPKDNRKTQRPIWASQIAALDGDQAVGFLDLMELRFVDAFTNLGLSHKTVRLAAAAAKEMFGVDHPFATRSFRTDGKRVLAKIDRRGESPHLLDLGSGQFTIYDVVVPTLFEGVDFDDCGAAKTWRPMKDKAPLVILDPLRSFGRPIIDTCGIPTAVLATAARVEGSVDEVAAQYEVDIESVEQAVLFEMRQAA